MNERNSANAEAMRRAGMGLTDDTRMLNVRQPWADELVNGEKDIENRPNHLKLQFPAWVFIVASNSSPTRKNIVDLKKLRNGPIKDKFPKQTIIGAVQFVASATFHPSKWYNGGADKAWVVGSKFALPFPISRIVGCLSPRKVSTHGESERIYRELGDFSPRSPKKVKAKRKAESNPRSKTRKESDEAIFDDEITPYEKAHPRSKTRKESDEAIFDDGITPYEKAHPHKKTRKATL